MKLAIRTIRSAVIGLLLLGLIVFVPAGTLAYWQGWAFIIVFTISTNIMGVYLALKDPALLERRIKAGPGAETRPAQKVLISIAFAGMIALVVVSALDHRFGWSHVPVWVSLLGNVLVALGLMIDLRVFRENSYGASTIRKMEGQKVIPPALMLSCGIPCMSAHWSWSWACRWRWAPIGVCCSCCSTCRS